MTLFQAMPILDERKSFGAELAGRLGQAAGQTFPQELARGLENQALRRYGINLGGVRDPGLRQDLARRALDRQMAFGQAMVGAGLAPAAMPMEGMAPTGMPQGAPTQRAGMPMAGAMPMMGAEAPPSQAPTTDAAARTLQKQQSSLQRQIQQGAAFGMMPDVEKIKENQEKYMGIYENALLNTLAKDEKGNLINVDKNGRPIFSAEEIAAARELGQNAYDAFLDEGTIQRQATQFANRLRNAKAQAESILAPGFQRNLENFFKGNLSRTDEKKLLSSASSAVKELVDLGLTGEAREALARAKWNPEQIESIIQKASGSGFSEETQSVLKSLPMLGKVDVIPSGVRKGEVLGAKPMNPQNFGAFKQAFDDIISKDPNANLILLRKAFEEKGVDWQSFKQAVDEAAVENRINTRSKAYQYAERVLEEPPLGFLERLLMAYGVGGRG